MCITFNLVVSRNFYLASAHRRWSSKSPNMAYGWPPMALVLQKSTTWLNVRFFKRLSFTLIPLAVNIILYQGFCIPIHSLLLFISIMLQTCPCLHFQQLVGPESVPFKCWVVFVFFFVLNYHYLLYASQHDDSSYTLVTIRTVTSAYNCIRFLKGRFKCFISSNPNHSFFQKHAHIHWVFFPNW